MADGMAGLAFATVLGESEAIERARRAGVAAAGQDGALVLVGEPGTGKKLLGRAIHDGGVHSGRPLVLVDCASLVHGEALQALFGRESPRTEGALEAADSGTVLLSRCGRLPAEVQRALLEALRDGAFRRVGGRERIPVRFRVVALMTPLRERENGELATTLGAMRVELPPLRDRDGDVRILARHFARELSSNGRSSRLSDGALRMLDRHRWPGNVRELRTVVAHALQAAHGETVTRRHISVQSRSWVREGEAGEIQIPSEGMSLSDIEREAVRITLRITGGNRSEAARLLGISRPTLLRKLRRVQESGADPWTAG